MSRENNISYFRKVIYYFKSCEVSPTVDEEDRLWNNIMSEISASRRRRISLRTITTNLTRRVI